MKRALLALRGRVWAERRQRVAAGMVLVVVGALGYGAIVDPALQALESAELAEPDLKADYVKRLRQAASFEPLQALQRTAQQTIVEAEGPPATGAALASLVSLARQQGLSVELLEAEDAERLADYAAVRSAQIRLVGGYTQFAGFAEALAAKFPQVALRNLVWQTVPDGAAITLEAVADTRRWLTVDEIIALKKRQAKDRRR